MTSLVNDSIESSSQELPDRCQALLRWLVNSADQGVASRPLDWAGTSLRIVASLFLASDRRSLPE